MRTTLNIEDEALMVIKKYAEEREVSLGQAASDLVYRGAESIPELKTKNGWVVFDGTTPLTNEKVRELEALDGEDEYRRAFAAGR